MTAAIHVAMREGALAADLRGTLEDGILERLAWLHRSSGGYLQAVEPLEASIGGASTMDDVWRELLGRQPAVMVQAGDGDYANAGANRKLVELELQVEVYFVSQHYGSRHARLAGDAASVDGGKGDPGIRRMMADAIALLWDYEVGNFTGLTIRTETPIIQDSRGTIWQQVWSTRTHFSPPELPADVYPPVAGNTTTTAVLDQESPA